MRSAGFALTALVLALAAAPPPTLVLAQGEDVQAYLADARRSFDQLEYDKTVAALDRAIPILEARPAQDPLRRDLPGAYEMRARSRFGLGDQDGARADFVSLVRNSPGYSLTGQVSPRVVSLFNDVVKAALDCPKPVIMTLHKKSRNPLLQDLRRRDDVRILEVTPVNKNLLPYKIEKLMKDHLQTSYY